MCAYGQPYKKPTSILTNMSWLESLQRRRAGGHVHEQLRGSETVVIDGKPLTRNRTTGAGAYPARLCKVWAQELRHHAPSGALGASRPDDVLSFLHGLETAAGGAHSTASSASSRGVCQSDCGQDTEQFLVHAKDYINTHPVVFGHFNAFDIAKLAGHNRGHTKATQAAPHHS